MHVFAGGDQSADSIVQCSEINFVCFFFQLDGQHPTTNVHAYQVGADSVIDSHGGSDGASGSGVGICHDADLGVFGYWLVNHVLNLSNGFGFYRSCKDFCVREFTV